MGAGPQQLPRTDLPGAEYFALAPNRSVALGPRLQGSVSSGNVSVPATSVLGPQISILVDPNWTYGSALYLVRAYATFNAVDNALELQIVSARMGLGQTPGGIFLDMGLPTATLTTPAGSPIVAIYERDALVSQLDFPTFPINTPLFMDFTINAKNNDPTNPHSFSVSANAVWHTLRGFVQ